MKQMLAALMFLSLSIMPMKKADAGIIVIASGTATGGALAVGYVLGGLGVAGAVGSGILMAQGDFQGVGLGIILAMPSALLLTLDADGALPKEQLIKDLSKKYAFIENQEVIADLSEVIRAKAGQDFAPGSSKLVSLSSEEVMEILAPLDLSGYESEVQAMIKDLE